MRSSSRVWIVVAACLAYGGVSTAGIAFDWPYHELIGFALQCLVLVPACWWALQGPLKANSEASEPFLSSRTVRFLIVGYFLVTSLLSWRVSQGMMVTDENAYRFEARTLASGRLFAPLPPGAALSPEQSPPPLRFTHAIYSTQGWIFHFPLGWPALLAIPSRLGLEWLVNPILGVVLIVLIGAVAREQGGERLASVAMAIAALSPYLVGNTVGLMSHGLSGVLVAAAGWQFIRGIRSGRLGHFAWMLGLLVLLIQVRLFTGGLTAAVLGVASLVMVRHDTRLLVRVLGLSLLSGAVAVALVAAYNQTVTGSPMLSPYAVSRGLTDNAGILAGLTQMAGSVFGMYRGAFQGTVLYAFPGVLVLAAIGFRNFRREAPEATVLGVLFVVLMVAHLVQSEPLSSVAGERYWFEGYFGVVVLAAAGVLGALDAQRPSRTFQVVAAGSVLVLQTTLTAATAIKLDRLSSPQRKIEILSRQYSDCDCVVFLQSGGQDFAQHFGLNRPDWPARRLFFAIDPGPELRSSWTGRLHKQGWVVIGYDPLTRRAGVVAASVTPGRSAP